MGKNQRRRKQIASHQQQVLKHHQKIAQELKKASPDYQLIAKWRKDIEVFEANIAKYEQKLPGRKKR